MAETSYMESMQIMDSTQLKADRYNNKIGDACWLSKLEMEESGVNHALIASSKGLYAQRLNDGLLSIQSLMQHVLDKKSILTQDALLNIIHARTADLITLRKRSK